MPTLSVVIPTHNKHPYLAETLACLGRQRVSADEVIVVDDASDPPVMDPTGVAVVLRREGPPHPQAARNLGLALATGDLVLLMDDDGLARDDWVAIHRWRHERDPGHLVVGSVRRIDFRGESEFWTLPVSPSVEETRTFQARFERLIANAPPWNIASCTNHVSVAREALLQVGGYDEAYCGWGVDDVDLTYRLMRAGVPLLIDAAPVIYHQEHPCSPEAQRAEEFQNLCTFARHHGFWPYGNPPADFQGPQGYPAEGAWFDVRALLREGEPPAFRVTAAGAPNPDSWMVGRGPWLPADGSAQEAVCSLP